MHLPLTLYILGVICAISTPRRLGRVIDTLRFVLRSTCALLDFYLPARLSFPIIPPFLLPSDIADELLDSFIDDLLTILPDSPTAIDTVLGEVSCVGPTVSSGIGLTGALPFSGESADQAGDIGVPK